MRRIELAWRNLLMVPRLALRGDKASWRLIGGLVYLIAYGGYWIFVSKKLGSEVLVYAVVLMVIGVGCARLVGYHNNRASASLLNLSARPAPAEDDLAQHRDLLAKELLRLCALVDRAGVEAFHRQVPGQDAQGGAIRRRSLEAARRPGVWELLTEEEIDLLISAEGGWTEEMVQIWLHRVEDVRVLRWVLCLDEVLVPFHLLQRGLRPAYELSAHPERVNGSGCLAAYDLRPAQTMAERMLERCLAEGTLRGEFAQEDAELKQQLMTFAERMHANPASDLLAGASTVAAADWNQTFWLMHAAMRRHVVLGALIPFLNEPAGPELRFGGLERGRFVTASE